MKTQLGKQTGLALALLATLLATFLAMGVFSVAQAQESPSATRSFPNTVEPGEIVDGYHHCQRLRTMRLIVTETLPRVHIRSQPMGAAMQRGDDTPRFVVDQFFGPDVSIALATRLQLRHEEREYTFSGTYSNPRFRCDSDGHGGLHVHRNCGWQRWEWQRWERR